MKIKKMIFQSKPRRGEKTIAQGETLGVVSKANKPWWGATDLKLVCRPCQGWRCLWLCSPDFIRGYYLAVPSGLSSEILCIERALSIGRGVDPATKGLLICQ